nr:MAG TPA: hypothetical protein [Caudoviricetes sp.]
MVPLFSLPRPPSSLRRLWPRRLLFSSRSTRPRRRVSSLTRTPLMTRLSCTPEWRPSSGSCMLLR